MTLVSESSFILNSHGCKSRSVSAKNGRRESFGIVTNTSGVKSMVMKREKKLRIKRALYPRLLADIGEADIDPPMKLA